MRFSTARSLVLATLLPTLVLFALVTGCAKQSEGERCGDSLGPTNNDDCGDNLTCTNLGPDNYRCCYSDGRISDSRCERSTAMPGGGASSGGGAGKAGAGTGTGGAATAGGGSSGSVAGGSPEAGEGN